MCVRMDWCGIKMLIYPPQFIYVQFRCVSREFLGVSESRPRAPLPCYFSYLNEFTQNSCALFEKKGATKHTQIALQIYRK
jgi:hypothetical protein